MLYSSLEDNISLFSIICFVFVLYSVFNEHISALGSTNNFVFRKTNASPAVVTAWWRRWESNPLPLECHSSALPSELRPHWDISRDDPWKLNNDLETCISTFFGFFAEIRACSSEHSHFLHRKEVIQPHLPIRLPCYDLTPIIIPTFDYCLLAVSS